MDIARIAQTGQSYLYTNVVVPATGHNRPSEAVRAALPARGGNGLRLGRRGGCAGD